MKFSIVVEQNVQKLVVIPETEAEQRFLGVLVPKPLDYKLLTVADVNTRYESHYSDRRVASMELVFTGQAPRSAHT